MSQKPVTARRIRREPRQARSQERVNRILDLAEELFAGEGYALQGWVFNISLVKVGQGRQGDR